MEEQDKAYLFIFPDGKIEKYVTDSYNFLKAKEEDLFIPNGTIDRRIALLGKAVYDKIRIHHKLEPNQIILTRTIEDILKELNLNDRVQIDFNASGRATDYIFFNREDSETYFSWKSVTAESYRLLKFNIEYLIKTPLSSFTTIFISPNLISKNALFSLLKAENEWGNKIEINSQFNQRAEEYRELRVLTEEERRKKIESLLEELAEKGKYEALEQELRSGASTDIKMASCRLFVKEFPNSRFKINIDAKLLELGWAKADTIKTISSYLDFVREFKYRSHIENHIEAAFKGISNIEEEYKKIIKPLESEISNLQSERVGHLSEIHNLSEDNLRYKRKTKFFIIGVLAALFVGIGSTYIYAKNQFKTENHNVVEKNKENPLLKRIDMLIENQIYLRLQQINKESQGVVLGTVESATLLRTQQNLYKALYDIHELKFETLPLLDSNKISTNEVEKEILKIESQIK